MNILIRARIRLPDVPLIGRRDKRLRQAARHGTLSIFYDKRCRQRRPTVGEKDCAEEVVGKPGPVRGFIVVTRKLTAYPRAAVLHILLEYFALFGVLWRIVQPHH